eukprot:7798162-Pyramimonas_sp.AAC.1
MSFKDGGIEQSAGQGSRQSGQARGPLQCAALSGQRAGWVVLSAASWRNPREGTVNIAQVIPVMLETLLTPD